MITEDHKSSFFLLNAGKQFRVVMISTNLFSYVHESTINSDGLSAYHIIRYFTIFHFPSGSITQLIEHCTEIRKVKGMNPIQT